MFLKTQLQTHRTTTMCRILTRLNKTPVLETTVATNAIKTREARGKCCRPSSNQDHRILPRSEFSLRQFSKFSIKTPPTDRQKTGAGNNYVYTLV